MLSILNIITVINWLLISYFTFSAIYFLYFSVLSYRYKKSNYNSFNNYENNYLILIPAYKEDNVILESAINASIHYSSKAKYCVWVIADSLSRYTLNELERNNINTLEVSFKKSTKAKAINKALLHIKGNYSHVILLDADNIMADKFIDEIDRYISAGYSVVQGRRIAKNSNNNLAILDGLSEGINNTIFRKGHFASGLSSALIGSGFAISYDLFRKTMLKISAVGGFDKALEYSIISKKVKIAFNANAVVLDEKVQNSKNFTNQRRRWISAQLVYFKKYFLNGVKLLVTTGNIDAFDKAIQFALPPRLLTLFSSISFIIVHSSLWLMLKSNQLKTTLLLWTICFFICSLAILLAIPYKDYPKSWYRPIRELPRYAILMVSTLFRLKNANKQFIHTEHGLQQNTTTN